MMPALAILGGAGVRGRRWFLPLPLFLLWPLVLVVLAAMAIGTRVLRPSSSSMRAFQPSDLSQSAGRPLAAARLTLRAFCQLRGLRIDVRSSDGEGFRLWFI